MFFLFFIFKFQISRKFLVKCRETNPMLTLYVLSLYLLEKCSGLIIRQSQILLLLLLLLLLLYIFCGSRLSLV